MGRPALRSLLPWLGLALLLLFMDQASKLLILDHYQYGEGSVVTSFLNIVRVHNSGAAFSFLAGASGWQRWFFVGIALVATVVILTLLYKHPGQKMFSLALACILGGAVGNGVDRIAYGYVVDFIDVHWQWLSPLFPGGHFPAFNIADCAISAGAALLILDELLRMRGPRR